MKIFNKKIRISTFAPVAYAAVWLHDKSYRVKHYNYNPEMSPVIYAVWHGWQYGLLSVHPRKKLHLLVSKSEDGEFVGRFSQMLGYPLIRGSIKKGGTQALRDILKTLKNGDNVAYTVDGPKGPIHKVKEGIIKIAQLSGAPIVPVVPAAKFKLEAKSWDKYQVPILFSKVANVFGDPIYIPEDINEIQKEEYRLMLENKLFELKEQAESYLM